MRIRIKRVYEEPGRNDGTRILVDRMWPRGIRKEDAGVERWRRDVAPSAELCKWFGHDPSRWEEFKSRYARELDGNPEAVEALRGCVRGRTLTLVYAARDEEHNNAVALKEYLER